MMGITPVNEPITLYALTPHMHLRGKSMKWWVTYPDGREETILDVPNFDFNWQIQYELATPLQGAGRQQDHQRGHLRQLGEEPVEPGARERRVLVGAELGRDVPADDAVLGRQPRPHQDQTRRPASSRGS